MASEQTTINLAMRQLAKAMREDRKDDVVKIITMNDRVVLYSSVQTVAQYAAVKGYTDILELIESIDPKTVFMVGDKVVPPIIIAALYGHRETFDFLYERVQRLKERPQWRQSFGSEGRANDAHYGHASLIEFFAGKMTNVQQTLNYYLSTFDSVCGHEIPVEIISVLLGLCATLEGFLDQHPWITADRREQLTREIKVCFDHLVDDKELSANVRRWREHRLEEPAPQIDAGFTSVTKTSAPSQSQPHDELDDDIEIIEEPSPSSSQRTSPSKRQRSD